MFKPLSVFVALRYTRAKRKNHFISFISLSSLLGIALGVMVLITVLSVMNGFDYEIKNRVFSLASQLTVTQQNGKVSDWQRLAARVKPFTHVQAIAPYVSGQGMLVNEGVVQGAMVFGILPSQQKTISALTSHMIAGNLSLLKPHKFGIVIGSQLAENLNLNLGDKVTLVIPEASVTPAGILPRFKRFTVVGIFSVGKGFGYDSSYAYVAMQDAQALFQLGESVSGIQLKLDDLYLAPKVGEAVNKALGYDYLVTDWTEEFGSFFHAIALEKNMMFIILILIIAVAAFNLVSSLVMTVTDKQSDIAILRTLGASSGLILRIFMLQGLLVGIFGIVLGLLSGILLATHVTALASGLQHLLHVQLLSSDVYYVDYLPSRLDWYDVLKIAIVALGLCLLATLYPAWRAARVEPAEALRYE